MSISSLYSNSSSGSSRKSSLDRPAIGARKLSIELLPNQSIFRETFIGHAIPTLSSPTRSPVSEIPPSPTDSLSPSHPTCTACAALTSSPILRHPSCPSASYKRHAVILPTRHHGAHCRMPSPTRNLPALPSIGEDCLMEWERKGSMAIAINTPSPSSSRNSTPLSSPAYAVRSGDYFANAALGSRFSVDTVAEGFVVGSVPSPKLGGRGSPRVGSSVGRPGTPVTPTKDYRSFLRML
ncbi:hypothetical protein KVT40_007339 [Elsinoe batatas]|uniref:Uncharacterized protein n=1 Tax=Elsinoe batatas TaxID=2601811 RepID=A0A8K0PD61_9PEZI|nr:hypothetical protein KVT40_007339 [Elsinoe batatas]